MSKIISALPDTVTSTALGDMRCTASAGSGDLHIWLDPVIAICMVKQIRSSLAGRDSKNSETYRKNADLLIKRLKSLDNELKARLLPLKGKRYLVFHDAYAYFEKRYGLKSAGFFRKLPDRLPGAGHIIKLRRRIVAGKIKCIFTEPEFIPAQVRVVIKETGLKTGVLDPLGGHLTPGPDQYFKLMRNLAGSLQTCLKGQ